MQARYIRSLLFLLLLNLLIKPLWLLGIDRNVQILTGVMDYGLYFALFNLSFAFQIFLDPGLHTYNNKTIAQQPQLLNQYLSAFLPLKVFLSAAFICLTILLALVLGYHAPAVELLFYLTLVQVLSSFLLYMRSNLTALHLFNTDSIFSVLDRSLMILICGYFVWVAGAITIRTFAFAQLAATGLSATLAAVVVLRKSHRLSFNLHWGFLKDILRQSYPFALLAILMTLYSRADALMLERLLPEGKVQAGIYAMGFRLLEAANMIAFLFATILMPILSAMLHRREKVNEVVNTFAKLLLVPAYILVLACWAYRSFIMQALYPGTEYLAQAADVLGLLMPGFIATSAIYIYGTLLTANGNLRFLNILALCGFAANMLVNFILIPRYGASGAAAATLATQGMVALAQYLLSVKRFSLHITLAEAARLAAFVLFSAGCFVFLQDIIASPLLNMLLLMAISFTFAVISGVIKLKYFYNLLKFNK